MLDCSSKNEKINKILTHSSVGSKSCGSGSTAVTDRDVISAPEVKHEVTEGVDISVP